MKHIKSKKRHRLICNFNLINETYKKQKNGIQKIEKL